MSVGITEGVDLTQETLEFIDTQWGPVASTFTQSSAQGWQYDNQQYDTVTGGSADVWTKPVLRNGDNKTLYPSGDTNGYMAALRNNDVVTVALGDRVDEVVGSEFDFDVARDVEVTCEALPSAGFSVVGDTTDWRVFVHIVRRAVMVERQDPLSGAGSNYDWRWISVEDTRPLPEAEDNRDRYGTIVQFRWYGFESLP